MKKRSTYFVATFVSSYNTKVEMSLPLRITTWLAAVGWLSPRIPKNHVLYSIRIEVLSLESLCDNQETQTKEQTSAE